MDGPGDNAVFASDTSKASTRVVRLVSECGEDGWQAWTNPPSGGKPDYAPEFSYIWQQNALTIIDEIVKPGCPPANDDRLKAIAHSLWLPLTLPLVAVPQAVEVILEVQSADGEPQPEKLQNLRCLPLELLGLLSERWLHRRYLGAGRLLWPQHELRVLALIAPDTGRLGGSLTPVPVPPSYASTLRDMMQHLPGDRHHVVVCSSRDQVLKELEDQAASQKPNVLAWIGHGEERDGTAWLSCGNGEYITGTQLVAAIGQMPNLQLVLALSCRSNERLVGALLDGGLPAAVGVHFDIHCQTTLKFLKEMLAGLAEALPLPRAFNRGLHEVTSVQRCQFALHTQGTQQVLLAPEPQRDDARAHLGMIDFLNHQARECRLDPLLTLLKRRGRDDMPRIPLRGVLAHRKSSFSSERESTSWSLSEIDFSDEDDDLDFSDEDNVDGDFGGFSPAIADIYYELRDYTAGYHGDGAADPSSRPLDDLKDKQVLVLVGEPGAGKSTFLKQVAVEASDSLVRTAQQRGLEVLDGCLIPLWVPLKDLHWPDNQTEREQRALRLRDMLTACGAKVQSVLTDGDLVIGAIFELLVRSHRLPESWVGRLWSPLRGTAHRVLLLLDGLDELRSGQRFLQSGLAEISQWRGCRLMLSSRPTDCSFLPNMKANWESTRLEVEVQRFTYADTQEIVRRFFATDQPVLANELLKELEDKPSMAQMAANPLMATLLCMAFAPDGAERLVLPAQRAAVFDRVVTGLLREWPRADNKPRVNDLNLVFAKQCVLEELALRSFLVSAQAFNLTEANQYLFGILGYSMSEQLKRDGTPVEGALRVYQLALLDHLVTDGALVRDGDRYAFLHLTIQEYLVARALTRRANHRFELIAQLIDAVSWDPAWEQVILLLAGLLKNPAPLLELLGKEADDDAFAYRLCLAARCLGELDEQKRPGGADSVALRFSTLWWQWHQAPCALPPHLLRSANAVSAAPLLATLDEQFDVNSDIVMKAWNMLGCIAATPERMLRVLNRVRAEAPGSDGYVTYVTRGPMTETLRTMLLSGSPEIIKCLVDELTDEESMLVVDQLVVVALVRPDLFAPDVIDRVVARMADAPIAAMLAIAALARYHARCFPHDIGARLLVVACNGGHVRYALTALNCVLRHCRAHYVPNEVFSRLLPLYSKEASDVNDDVNKLMVTLFNRHARVIPDDAGCQLLRKLIESDVRMLDSEAAQCAFATTAIESISAELANALLNASCDAWIAGAVRRTPALLKIEAVKQALAGWRKKRSGKAWENERIIAESRREMLLADETFGTIVLYNGNIRAWTPSFKKCDGFQIEIPAEEDSLSYILESCGVVAVSSGILHCFWQGEHPDQSCASSRSQVTNDCERVALEQACEQENWVAAGRIWCALQMLERGPARVRRMVVRTAEALSRHEWNANL